MTDSDLRRLAQRKRDHRLAIRAMACAVDVLDPLGETVESARLIGNARNANEHADAWFEASNLTLVVRFHAADAEGARKALVSLFENGFHGFVGAFEVDDVKIDGELVVVCLRQGSDREPLDDPETLVAAAARLMP